MTWAIDWPFSGKLATPALTDICNVSPACSITSALASPASRRAAPKACSDPQARSTFEASRLDWDEQEHPQNARHLAWVRTLKSKKGH